MAPAAVSMRPRRVVSSPGHGEHAIELGDGGFTTWTGQLMGNAKERCLVSCIATDRLVAARGTHRASGVGT
jgi:hypothetical protein